VVKKKVWTTVRLAFQRDSRQISNFSISEAVLGGPFLLPALCWALVQGGGKVKLVKNKCIFCLDLAYPFENGNEFIFQQFLSFDAPSIIIGAETPLPSGGFGPFSKGYHS